MDHYRTVGSRHHHRKVDCLEGQSQPPLSMVVRCHHPHIREDVLPNEGFHLPQREERGGEHRGVVGGVAEPRAFTRRPSCRSSRR